MEAVPSTWRQYCALQVERGETVGGRGGSFHLKTARGAARAPIPPFDFFLMQQLWVEQGLLQGVVG